MCTEGTAFDVPVYISLIAVVFNLTGVSDAGKQYQHGRCQPSPKIFDGKITKWNDPAIADQNKDLKLPDTAITVVHRSDKSGTTQNLSPTSRTSHLTTGPTTSPRTGRTRLARCQGHFRRDLHRQAGRRHHRLR